jgi:DNA-directed RNA polymerase II subunit RPB4
VGWTDGDGDDDGDDDDDVSFGWPRLCVCADWLACRMLAQTQRYLDAFARFTQKENVEAVERLLSAYKQLAKFERAQLGTLCCETAEEAKTLIPSLQDKISDESLQELLEEIVKLQNQ